MQTWIKFFCASTADAADALRKAMSDASSSAEYDAFLTHDWGDDELGRSNHARVAEVNRLLKAAGFVTWFDEDRMQGDIVSQMANGGASQCARPSTP